MGPRDPPEISHDNDASADSFTRHMTGAETALVITIAAAFFIGMIYLFLIIRRILTTMGEIIASGSKVRPPDRTEIADEFSVDADPR
jgi:hypothetical protein